MMKGRNLINAVGIPAWLFLIWKGGLFYSIFILICTVIALGEFYRLMEQKEPAHYDGWEWPPLYLSQITTTYSPQ